MLPYVTLIILFHPSFVSADCTSSDLEDWLDEEPKFPKQWDSLNFRPFRDKGFSVNEEAVQEVSDEHNQVPAPGAESDFPEGTAIELQCRRRHSRPAIAKEGAFKVICKDSKFIAENEDEEFNVCISADYCSVAEFEHTWQMSGYDEARSIARYKMKGPLIAHKIVSPNKRDMVQLLRQMARRKTYKSPRQIQMANKGDIRDHVGATWVPAVPMKCQSFSPIGLTYELKWSELKHLPHAFCVKEDTDIRAKWKPYPKIGSEDVWLEETAQCVEKVGKPKSSPPPDGCTVLSQNKGDCKTVYKKYCAWVKNWKHDKKFMRMGNWNHKAAEKDICTKFDCIPRSCYGSPTQDYECDKLMTKPECKDDDDPGSKHFCKWNRKEMLCEHRAKDDDGQLREIEVEICSTASRRCRMSKSTGDWTKMRKEFSGRPRGGLKKLQFGWNYKLFGIRHRVQDLSALRKMRGDITTQVRSRFQEGSGPAANRDEVQDVAATKLDPKRVQTKFNFVSRAQMAMLSVFFALDKLATMIGSGKSKPNPAFEYISVELNSLKLDLPSQPISFWLETYVSKDCKLCQLVKYQGSGQGAQISTANMVLFTGQPTWSKTYALVKMEFPTMDSKGAGREVTLEAKMKPAPERCGKPPFYYGCYVTLEPQMNDVAEALMKWKAKLSIMQRLKGFDDSGIPFIGRRPSKRRRKKTKYFVKTAKAERWAPYFMQFAEVRWNVDMGNVKGIRLRLTDLPLWQKDISQPMKIGWKSTDKKLTMKPGNCKWVWLRAKKNMVRQCNIDSHCGPGCNLKIRPKPVWLFKNFKRKMIKICAEEPGEFQVQFVVVGKCALTVDNPPPILVKVVNPSAGYIKVPETLPDMMNGEWTEEFDISITRPPFYQSLTVQPITQEFMADPGRVQFKSTESPSNIRTWSSSNKESEEMRVKFVGECGGGPPREIRWQANGDKRDFYTPGSTWIKVWPSDMDPDYCVGKMLANWTNETETIDQILQQDDGELDIPDFAAEPIIKLPEWRFEYYLLGGAIQICIFVVIDNCKAHQHDRILEILSQQLTTQR